MYDFDLAIVGSGFAGSLAAMMARRLGYSVVMLERGRHPRFVIGESSTPLADLLWTELARAFDLPRLEALSKWGSWQRAYPQIGCGLKRGFTFLHHQFDQPFQHDHQHQHELLVAASPRDEVADTHWYRPDFDRFLVREAQALGAEYLDQTKLDGIAFVGGGAELAGEREGRPVKLRVRLVVDASGPHGFLRRQLSLPAVPFEHLPPTQALYSHFRGVRRLDQMGIGWAAETPPYPVDDAAVHHVFEGGWIWVLRFNNGIASAGVAATDPLAKPLVLSDGAAAWSRLLERLPTVREQFAAAEASLPFVHVPRLAFRSELMHGPNWVLLPYAAGFVDPLLSTGFPLTLLGLLRLGKALAAGLGSPGFDQLVADYARQAQAELLAAERLVAALYAAMPDFPSFVNLALVYFAAVHYAESARRQGQSARASGYLLHDHPHFGPASRECCQLAFSSVQAGGWSTELREQLRARVSRAIEPIDLAHWSAPARRNWFPCAG